MYSSTYYRELSAAWLGLALLPVSPPHSTVCARNPSAVKAPTVSLPLNEPTLLPVLISRSCWSGKRNRKRKKYKRQCVINIWFKGSNFRAGNNRGELLSAFWLLCTPLLTHKIPSPDIYLCLSCTFSFQMGTLETRDHGTFYKNTPLHVHMISKAQL